MNTDNPNAQQPTLTTAQLGHALHGLFESFSAGRKTESLSLLQAYLERRQLSLDQANPENPLFDALVAAIRNYEADDAALLAHGTEVNLSPLEYEGLVHYLIYPDLLTHHGEELKQVQWKVMDLFLNADTLEPMLTTLFNEFEGHACCADKGRTVFRYLLRHLATKAPIEFNYQAKYTYHLPKRILRTQSEILAWYRCAHLMLNGKPAEYLLWYADAKQKLNLEGSVR